jgi:hypothetical protein
MHVRVGVSWAAGGLLVASGLRRLAHRTGVSDEEAYGSLPGDEVIAHPMLEWNRGITIAAPPEAIWPWLVQLGYGRAGWYTPEAFDRFMHRWVWLLEQGPSVPAQPLAHPARASAARRRGRRRRRPQYAAYLRVMALQPARHLVYYSLRHPGGASRSTPPTRRPCRPARKSCAPAAVPGVLLGVRAPPGHRGPHAAAAAGPQQRRPAVAGGVAGCPHRPGGCL